MILISPLNILFVTLFFLCLVKNKQKVLSWFLFRSMLNLLNWLLLCDILWNSFVCVCWFFFRLDLQQVRTTSSLSLMFWSFVLLGVVWSCDWSTTATSTVLSLTSSRSAPLVSGALVRLLSLLDVGSRSETTSTSAETSSLWRTRSTGRTTGSRLLPQQRWTTLGHSPRLKLRVWRSRPAHPSSWVSSATTKVFDIFKQN